LVFCENAHDLWHPIYRNECGAGKKHPQQDVREGTGPSILPAANPKGTESHQKWGAETIGIIVENII
jgi:hypothetical protein